MEAVHPFVLSLHPMLVLCDGFISAANGCLKGGDVGLELGDDVIFVLYDELMDV